MKPRKSCVPLVAHLDTQRVAKSVGRQHIDVDRIARHLPCAEVLMVEHELALGQARHDGHAQVLANVVGFVFTQFIGIDARQVVVVHALDHPPPVLPSVKKWKTDAPSACRMASSADCQSSAESTPSYSSPGIWQLAPCRSINFMEMNY